MVDLDKIETALAKIHAFIHRTPTFLSHSLSDLSGAEVHVKAENLQKTGSFKVRGAFNKIGVVPGEKVVAASMGNHAQGVAYAAATLGKRSRIVMPLNSSIVKQEATRGYGAEVVLHGESFQEALAFAMAQEDYTFIHAYDDFDVIAGQGTTGREIIRDLEEVDSVIVPVGGGGIIAGISTVFKSLSPRTEVIGVQTASAPSAALSFREKSIVESSPCATLADGIAVGRIGEKTFGIIRRLVDDILLVDEDSIAAAVLFFLERTKTVVEGAGAVTLAALLQNRERFSGKRVVLVVTGGNIDFTLIDRIIHKGLVSSSRIGVFEVAVDDIPGTLYEVTAAIAAQRGNILNVVHDRTAPDLPVGKTRVVFTVETRGKSHLDEILQEIRKRGFEVRSGSGPRS